MNSTLIALSLVSQLIFSLLVPLLLWWVRLTRSSIDSVNIKQEKLFDSILDLQLSFNSEIPGTTQLLIGQYVRREELDKINSDIMRKLDKIEALEVSIAQTYVTKVDLNTTLISFAETLKRIENKVDRTSNG